MRLLTVILFIVACSQPPVAPETEVAAPVPEPEEPLVSPALKVDSASAPIAAPLTQDAILKLLASDFAVGLMTETAIFDSNSILCGSLNRQELPATQDALEKFDKTLDVELRLALGHALTCVSCTQESLDACWKLPAYIRRFGGKVPRLTLGDETPVVGAAQTKIRKEIFRKFDAIIDEVVEDCDRQAVSSETIADVERLHDAVAAFSPPDDALLQTTYELAACVECGSHYIKFCDRAHYAIAHARRGATAPRK